MLGQLKQVFAAVRESISKRFGINIRIGIMGACLMHRGVAPLRPLKLIHFLALVVRDVRCHESHVEPPHLSIQDLMR